MRSKAGFVSVLGLCVVFACDSSENDPAGPSGGAGASAGQAGRPTTGGAGSGGTGAGAGASGKPAVGGTSDAAGRGGIEGGLAGSGGSGSGGSAAGAAAGGESSDGAGGLNDAGAGSGGEAGAAGQALPAVAYVSTVFGDLLLASLDEDSGAPTLLPSSPVEVEGSLHGVAVSTNGKYLFVPAEPARIDTYPIAADGSLPDAPSSSAPVDDDNPLLSMALDPLGRFAYGVSPFSQSIYVFKIDQESGVLTLSGEPVLIGPAPDHRAPTFVAPDPSGHFVYVTQQAAGLPQAENGIRAYSVDASSGAFTELADSPFSAGNVTAGAIVFRPDGKFLFSSGAGLNAFAVDTESGELDLVEGSPFSTDVGSDPWAPNLSMDPSGKLLYASNFVLTRHVTGFSIDAETGALEVVPGTPVTTSAPYSIALGPGGRFLYVGEDSGEISVFRVAHPSGGLTKLAESPFQFGGLEPDFAFLTLP
jgi:6-phosphogluconolactonase (cycloisomerase 2 family)